MIIWPIIAFCCLIIIFYWFISATWLIIWAACIAMVLVEAVKTDTDSKIAIIIAKVMVIIISLLISFVICLWI
jgi:hypothetical protein